MTIERPVQTSFLEGMDRPVGVLPLSVQTGKNADLIASVAPLYLTGSVLDVTYGRGMWWNRFRPDPFTFHDIELDGVDFTALPHDDRSFDAVCFDPPYITGGGAATKRDAERLRSSFGLAVGLSSRKLNTLVLDGLAEACRVSRQWVLVKCMEFAESTLNDMPTTVTKAAADLGFIVHDRIVHFTGSGPGGHNIFKVKRARRVHSYLIVFIREEMPKR